MIAAAIPVHSHLGYTGNLRAPSQTTLDRPAVVWNSICCQAATNFLNLKRFRGWGLGSGFRGRGLTGLLVLLAVGLCSTVGVAGCHHHHLQKESQRRCRSGSEEKLTHSPGTEATEQPFLRDSGTLFVQRYTSLALSSCLALPVKPMGLSSCFQFPAQLI